MEYVLVDLDGASRDYFDTQGAVRAALKELGEAAEFYVLVYNGAGEQLGEAIRGDEWLLIGSIRTGANKQTRTETARRGQPTTTVLGASRIEPPAVPA
jgi:hypothetical protein